MTGLRTDPWLSRDHESACLSSALLDQLPQQAIFRTKKEKIHDFCRYTKCNSDACNVIKASVVPTIGDVDSDAVCIEGFGVRRETDVGLEYYAVVARPLTAPSSLMDAV